MSKIGLITVLLLTIAAPSVLAQPQPSPPCGATYGSSADAVAIEDALYLGTVQQAIDAIRDGMETRGNRVGCRSDAWPYAIPDTTLPTLPALENLWNNVHAPGIAAYDDTLAILGREMPAAALGGYYAQLAGYAVSTNALQAIADRTEASQYSEKYAPAPLVTFPGVFGLSTELADDTSPSYRPGNVADTINVGCAVLGCPTYDSGPGAGIDYLVRDFSVIPRVFDGGLAYDHAWSSALMVEATLQETNPTKSAIYATSAALAADWSATEPAVRNHNYTAKNIWVLSQQYGLTGDATIKAALQDKLDRSLKPGVLMDANSDGLVDGMTNQAFSGLTQVAQMPGRMWDGHNSNMWYQSMNTWAAVEAYVAFRDQGDTALAADIRPYAIAMLDNLSWELTNLGPPGPAGEHLWPIPYSLLTGLWKIAEYEGETRSNWEDAAATLYNWGMFDSFSETGGRATASLGLYLLYMNGTPYVPLDQRLAGVPGPGDFDGDGDVDGFDFLKWQRGETSSPLSEQDLSDWEENFGTLNSGATAATAVPEPSTLLLLVLGFFVQLFRMRGRDSLGNC
ncbi:MAG: PEP-CTERM sorting domain-containing protein [Planctomycetes bacterium]|nr:PEP-CTERM sorting domain-containing protein [Planctomycetota bacterium]